MECALFIAQFFSKHLIEDRPVIFILEYVFQRGIFEYLLPDILRHDELRFLYHDVL